MWIVTIQNHDIKSKETITKLKETANQYQKYLPDTQVNKIKH